MRRSFFDDTTSGARRAAAFAIAAAALFVPGEASAYDRYSVSRNATNCRSCHGDFRASPYTSLSDGQSWADDLHDVHRNTMLGGDCDTCHSGSSRFPVLLATSAGGTGLSPISCVGCHGRTQDAVSGTNGTGAGLRQHHDRAGESVCRDCHSDADPAGKTVVGENVPPPYYAAPGTGHTIPTNPCNPGPGFTENYKGTTTGLDNDGDGVYDAADPDCAVTACGDGAVQAGEQCDDGNTVSGDCCSATCRFESAGSACDDGTFCTTGESCNGTGTCAGGAARSCDDGIACTTDSCNEATDACVHATSDAACSDGQFCNGVETCSATLGCRPGTAVNCDDGLACTTDSCNETTDACVHATSDAACADGVFCNGVETCSTTLGCRPGTVVNCDDGIACTTDSCNETTDACVHATSDAACSDGVFCNGVETCSVSLGCQAGTPLDCSDPDICTDDACDEAGDVCLHVFDPTNDPSCVVTACGNGRVEGGEECDDGNLANGDCCSAACQFETAGSACDDGLFCTTGTTCNGTGTCGGGTTLDCSDGIACTTDSCNESTTACVHMTSDAACSDGQFCNGVETCSATLGCRPGTAVACDDGIACTIDSCVEATDTCAHATSDAACADGLFCNGVETCSATLGCRAGAAADCDDGIACTTDTCVEATDSCAHATSDAACADGLFCNGVETCSATLGCRPGTPANCDDGIGCTTDTCDETADACAHATNDAACADGVFCNGVETCSAALGCRSATSFDCTDGEICTDDSCDEAADACEHVFDRTNDPSCAALCPDADGDGYSPVTVGCGAVDCDDSDPAIGPGATESCANDRDDDCDGRIDAADASCADVAWSVRPGTLENPAYAGSPACAACHPTQYETWSRSLHARMLTRPGDAQAAGFLLPEGTSISSWNDVLVVVGQKWRTLYVGPGGDLQPTQWNYARGLWSPYPGGPYSCGACHTTGYDAAATFVGSDGEVVPGIAGAWVEYNVGCEACHGPGADHAASPATSNINRLTLDWTSTGEGVVTPRIRAAEVCGQCHSRNGHGPGLDPQGRSETQYNDWKASPHSSTLELTTLSTYCAKCHSPGNARADAEEHYFSYFEPASATHVACVSCHDPHRISDERWGSPEWPQSGQRDPRDRPAALGRYRGTDDDPSTSDYEPFGSSNRNELCTDCHRTQPGFRRHVDAKPPVTVTLQPPFNSGQPFEVPHAEHVEEGNAECVSCHMPTNRTSINGGDVRSHTLRPNEVPLDGNVHYSDTCGQCHAEAEDCVWCHSDFGRSLTKQPALRAPGPRQIVREPAPGRTAGN